MKDNFYTLQQLIDNLTEYLVLTPQQQFRVTAKIKRLIHIEKENLYGRYSLYANGVGVYDHTDPNNPVLLYNEDPKDSFIYKILSYAHKNHKHWASLPDEDIVTWDVGTHKFRQGEDK